MRLNAADSGLQHQRKTIYGASMKKWSSHEVKSPSEIVHTGSFPIGGHRKHAQWNCSDAS